MGAALRLGVTGALVLSFASCAPIARPADNAADLEAVTIGAFLPLTGADARFGEIAKQAMELAAYEVNAAGGVHGRKLVLVFADDHSSAADATRVAQELIDKNHVVALIGEVGSARTLAAAMVADARKVPLVVPSATALEVTVQRDYVFRACFNDAQLAEAAAKVGKERLGRSKAVILRDARDPAAQGEAAVFAHDFRKRGGAVVLDQTFVPGDESKALAAVKDAAPDLIFAPVSYEEMPAVGAAARGAGLDGALFLGTDAWDSADLPARAGGALDGSRFVTHFSGAAPEAGGFVAAFQAKNGKPPTSLAALSYDALRVLVDAAARAPEPESDAIREALLQTRDFAGATGKLSWVASHEPRKAAYVVEIRSGALALAEVLPPSGGSR